MGFFSLSVQVTFDSVAIRSSAALLCGASSLYSGHLVIYPRDPAGSTNPSGARPPLNLSLTPRLSQALDPDLCLRPWCPLDLDRELCVCFCQIWGDQTRLFICCFSQSESCSDAAVLENLCLQPPDSMLPFLENQENDLQAGHISISKSSEWWFHFQYLSSLMICSVSLKTVLFLLYVYQLLLLHFASVSSTHHHWGTCIRFAGMWSFPARVWAQES